MCLVLATARQLAASLNVLSDIAELRKKGAIIYAVATANSVGGAGGYGGRRGEGGQPPENLQYGLWGGQACNPYDTARVPRGTSNGSGVSVAARPDERLTGRMGAPEIGTVANLSASFTSHAAGSANLASAIQPSVRRVRAESRPQNASSTSTASATAVDCQRWASKSKTQDGATR